MSTFVKVIIGLALTAVLVVGGVIGISLWVLHELDKDYQRELANRPTPVPAHTSEELCPANEALSGATSVARPNRDTPIVWCFPIGNTPGGSAVVDGDTVYIATGNPGDPQHQNPPLLYAVSADTGAERWRLTFPSDASLSAPAAADGLVLVCERGPGRERAELEAFEGSSGAERWRFDLSDAPHGASLCSAPVLDAGTVYVANNNQLHALDVQTGELRWQSQALELSPTTELAVAGGAIYVNGAQQVFAIDRESGEIQWRENVGVKQPGGSIRAPVPADGLVYVGVDVFRDRVIGELQALDASNGALVWRVGSILPIFSKPAVAGGLVYAEVDAELVALDARSGVERWRHTSGSAGDFSLAGGTLYFRSWNRLYSVDAASGRNHWSFDIGQGVYAPVALNGTVFIDGYRSAAGLQVMYAIDGEAVKQGPAPQPTPTATPSVLDDCPKASALPAGDRDSGTTGAVPMARADAAGSNHFPGPGPQGDPAMRWCLPLGATSGGGAALSDGTLYVTRNLGIGSKGQATLFALDAGTGIEQWRHVSRLGEVYSAPAVADGLVYTCRSSAASADGVLLALDAATGQERWRFAVADRGFGDVKCSDPVVTAGAVYISINNQLHALDAKTGVSRWESSRLLCFGAAQPAVANGFIYYHCNLQVTALSAETGALQWQTTIGALNLFEAASPVITSGAESPVVSDGLVFVAASRGGSKPSGELVALDAMTGAERWRVKSDSEINSNPAVAGGVVYVDIGDDLVALDTATGEERWRKQAGTVTGIAVAAGVVYIQAEQTDPGPHVELIALDAATGEQHWALASGWSTAPPILAGGTLYLIASDVAEGSRTILRAIGGSESPPEASPISQKES
jgi:outer membrane protein assembly factor BamB